MGSHGETFSALFAQNSQYVFIRIVTNSMPAADSQIVQHCNLNLIVSLLTVKKMSGQVRRKGRFINDKTLDYEVRRNSGLVEGRKKKYSAGNFTFDSKLVVCIQFFIFSIIKPYHNYVLKKRFLKSVTYFRNFFSKCDFECNIRYSLYIF